MSGQENPAPDQVPEGPKGPEGLLRWCQEEFNRNGFTVDETGKITGTTAPEPKVSGDALRLIPSHKVPKSYNWRDIMLGMLKKGGDMSVFKSLVGEGYLPIIEIARYYLKDFQKSAQAGNVKLRSLALIEAELLKSLNKDMRKRPKASGKNILAWLEILGIGVGIADGSTDFIDLVEKLHSSTKPVDEFLKEINEMANSSRSHIIHFAGYVLCVLTVTALADRFGTYPARKMCESYNWDATSPQVCKAVTSSIGGFRVFFSWMKSIAAEKWEEHQQGVYENDE